MEQKSERSDFLPTIVSCLLVGLIWGSTNAFLQRGKTDCFVRQFECVFLEHYSPLDNANIARDKLRKLKQCGTV